MSARPMLGDPAQPLLQRLGKYEIVGVLGQGAMGIVYNAIDPHIHRRVAVKAIRSPLLRPGAHELMAAQRFKTEAQAAGRLCHPNIVSVFEYGESGEDRFIAMEYVHGVSLLELTAQGRRLPLDDVNSLMMQLLDGLECAHEQGVWHRDIKPANLLVTPDGRLKITDFGIARIEASDLTQPSSVLGSPGYMAPERYTGDAPDCRVDIFSCGALFYELLTGTRPFRGSSSQIMYQVLHDTPPGPSTLAIDQPPPERFNAVVARALARRPEDRYASAAQMRAALLEVAGRPIAPHVSVATMMAPRPSAEEAQTVLLPRGVPSLPAAVATAPAPTVASPPAAPSAAATPASPVWDDRLLGAIEALLVNHLGPVARLVLRDAARRSADPHALVTLIATDSLEADEREGFLARARALLPAQSTAPAAAQPPAASSLPVLGSTPMTGSVIEKARLLLTHHIGPVASVIVRRAAAHTTSREAFFAVLVDQAGDDTDPKLLLAQLWRIE
ncbi:MAG: serine/threonine-protein kinase [Burkholderiales bacterium]|nr:serine/threonine-protein kinase [Burkholderiales bacterium]